MALLLQPSAGLVAAAVGDQLCDLPLALRQHTAFVRGVGVDRGVETVVGDQVDRLTQVECRTVREYMDTQHMAQLLAGLPSPA